MAAEYFEGRSDKFGILDFLNMYMVARIIHQQTAQGQAGAVRASWVFAAHAESV